MRIDIKSSDHKAVSSAGIQIVGVLVGAFIVHHILILAQHVLFSHWDEQECILCTGPTSRGVSGVRVVSADSATCAFSVLLEVEAL